MIDLPPPDPGIEITIASRGISKGLRQTDGAQFIVKPYVSFGPVQFGGRYKNVTSPVADGEAMLFANVGHEVGGFEFSAGAAYKFQTNVEEPTDSGALELSTALGRDFGRFGAEISLTYSPDDLGGTEESLYIEGGPWLKVADATNLSANVGRRERTGSPDYTSFNIGITHRFLKFLQADLRYYDTAQSHLGAVYDGRLVASLRAKF